MDPQLISKILRFSDPESSALIDTQHPLLDAASCRALSAGLVRLLRVSAAAPRARNALLSNIRALTTHAHSHHHSTQRIIHILTEYYSQLPTKQHEHTCDAFDDEISSFLSSQLENIKLENKIDKSTSTLVRALLNVNPENPYIKIVTKRFLLYESDKLVSQFLQEVWLNNIFTCQELVDKLSIRAKPEIERILLNASCNIISTEVEVSEILYSKPIKNLLHKSANSNICFQLCCRVLNSIFIRSNFNLKIQTFIQMFTESVKLSSTNFIALYHDDVQCLMMMLSCEEVMEVESEAANRILMHLKELRTNSEEQFIMVMSHCSQWFDYIVDRNIDLQ